jgi:hypothetical protein
MVKRARLAPAVVSLLFVACTSPADLSGEVSVTGTSGETRRGAGLDVILLRATSAFEAEWTRAVEAFQARRARAVAATKEVEEIRAQALADRVAASQSALGLLGGKDDVDWNAYDQALQRQGSALERMLKASRRGRETQAHLGRLLARERSDGWDLLRQYLTSSVRADGAGRFEFKGATPGRYYLASRLRLTAEEIYWFVAVDLRPGARQTTNLTEKNAGWPFS